MDQREFPWSNRIDLRVFPEVSQISSVSVLGVPGLDVRRTVSRVELKEGESLIIGGLLNRTVAKDLTKFPMRDKRSQAAEEAARKTVIKLIFPLVFFILPAIFIILLGPPGLGIVQMLSDPLQ